MATISYQLRSKSNPANIYLRLTVNREINLRRKTNFVINPHDWSKETGLPKQNNFDLKNLRTDLKELANSIEKELNKAIKNRVEITGAWLQDQIDPIQGIKFKTDENRVVNYIQRYISDLPLKDFGKEKRIAEATIKKYTTLKNKIITYEEYAKRRVYLDQVTPTFRNRLLKYFVEVDKLSNNTAGRYIRFLKTICIDAGKKGFEVSNLLSDVKGFSEKAAKVYLTHDELELIENAKYSREALENAKDWLIIGCYIGQRVPDLLMHNDKNINIRNGLKLIELIQKKTNKKISIPIPAKVQAILDKRKGQFPNKISDQKFNMHMKEICRLAQINSEIEGAKLVDVLEEEKGDEKMYRKVHGTFPKHELITSHVCRRSFATNFYGEIPTPLLISITGNPTEGQFLEYIGKNFERLCNTNCGVLE